MNQPLDRWVQKHLFAMRADPRQRRTVIGPAGTFRPLEDGETVLYAPDGTPVRVVERIGEHGEVSGNQVEHGDVLHAVVRPRTLRVQMQLTNPTISTSAQARPQPINIQAVAHTPTPRSSDA